MVDHAKIADQVLQSKKDTLICSESFKKGKVTQVVALGRCGRVYLMTPKRAGATVDFSGHIFYLSKLRSPDPNKLNLTFNNGAIDLEFPCTVFINHMRKLFNETFSGAEMFQCAVEPDSRLQELEEPAEKPCGGFVEAYVSICNAQGVAPRGDVIWDVENLYDRSKKKKFEVEDIDSVKPPEFNSLITTLTPNKYFTALSCSNITLDKNMAQSIGQMLAKNSTLEEINLSNTGLTKGLIAPIIDGLKATKTSSIQMINVSNNFLADKDLPMLGATIGEMSKGLISLDASNCGTKKGGAAGFINGLRKNSFMSGCLHKLNLSNNLFDNDGTVALSGFLAQPTGLQILNVQNCGIKLDQLFAALVRGCQSLEWLDISGNKLVKKDLAMMGQFLKAASHLKVLRMSNCAIDGDSLKTILNDINSNMYLNDLDLCISENRVGPSAARNLGPVLQSSGGIKKLDIAEMDLQADGLRQVLDSLSKNKALEHLDITGNFTGKAGFEEAIKAVNRLIESECPLNSLTLKGGKAGALRDHILPLFSCLASDDSLTTLDVSDNHFGMRGAMALGKALQTNKKLSSLRWDGNDTPYGGFDRFTHSLAANTTLKHMPIPVIDVGAAIRTNAHEMDTVLTGLNALITRNSNPEMMASFAAASGGAAAGGGGENAFLFKGEAAELKKLRNKVKALGRNLDGVEQIVMEDCETNDMGIAEIYQQREQAVIAMQSDLNDKLKGLAFDILPVINNHMNEMQGRIMGILEKRYSSMSRDTQNRLRLNMQFGAKDVDPEEVGKIIMESTAAQIIRKAEESYSSAIDISSDYIYEKLMEGLQNIIEEVVVQAEPAKPVHDEPEPEQEPSPVSARASGSGFGSPAAGGHHAPPRNASDVGTRGPGGPGAPPRGPPAVPPKRISTGPRQNPAVPGAGGPVAGGGPGAPPRPGGGRARVMGQNLFRGGPPPMGGGGRGYPMPGMGRGRGGGPPRPSAPQEPSGQSVQPPKARAALKAEQVEKPSGESGNLEKIETKESNVDNSVQRNRARGPAGKRPPTRRGRAKA